MKYQFERHNLEAAVNCVLSRVSINPELELQVQCCVERVSLRFWSFSKVVVNHDLR